MIYGVLKWIAGVALHWFYGDIRVVGREKIRRDVPLLIAVNHPNALVDSLVIGWLMPRPVVMTAKATLLGNPFIAALFRILGVVPLRRARDEASTDEASTQHGQPPPDPRRNAGAFQEMLRVLSRNGAVLIFPEGTSHNNKNLAPLKSGLARVALQARNIAHIRSVQIVPIGLLFENKETPGSIVGVRIGDPINVDEWHGDHDLLTGELAERLREVTEHADLPPGGETKTAAANPVKRLAIRVVAMWGRLTHRLPIQFARRLATTISTDADQPAMFTIVFGFGLVIATYAIQLAVVGTLAHSYWIPCLYLLTLLIGAYWAAFEPHVRR
jgi:1-acyl-sn-glycerol-3-phosphate acyltransferase